MSVDNNANLQSPSCSKLLFTLSTAECRSATAWIRRSWTPSRGCLR